MIRFLHLWLVKARVLPIPPGSRIEWWFKVLSLPPRPTPFERRVQSYIDQELKQ